MTPTQKTIYDKIRTSVTTSKYGMHHTISRETLHDNEITVWIFQVKREYDEEGKEPRYTQCSYQIGKRGQIDKRERSSEMITWENGLYSSGTYKQIPYPALSNH